MRRPIEAPPAIRVTRSGPVLPFRVPTIPSWVAVPAMLAIVAAMAAVCVGVVVS
jgi:hypothetical protein